MLSKVVEKLRLALRWAQRSAVGFVLPLRRPNISVWRNWEILTRTAGLGAIGVSIFAQGGQVEPGSVILGISALTASMHCAHIVGELEAQDDRFD
tara:strand:- start:4590 stop:4874 length:285 start_codon:yes stop_codon:yes gene_type:complete